MLDAAQDLRLLFPFTEDGLDLDCQRKDGIAKGLDTASFE